MQNTVLLLLYITAFRDIALYANIHLYVLFNFHLTAETKPLDFNIIKHFLSMTFVCIMIIVNVVPVGSVTIQFHSFVAPFDRG